MFIALVIDLRLKLKYVEWIVQRSYDYINSISMCERIRDTLVKLFDFYASSQLIKKKVYVQGFLVLMLASIWLRLRGKGARGQD